MRCSVDVHFVPRVGVNVDGLSRTANNTHETLDLQLQKVGQDADRSPSVDAIHQHILKISSRVNQVPSSREIKVQLPSVENNSCHPENENDICARVKNELQRFGVSQEVFAKAVVGKTQGYLSEMLKLGEKLFAPYDGTYSKGLNNFEVMRKFLAKPEEERRMIYRMKAEELKAERQRKRMVRKCPEFMMQILKVGNSEQVDLVCQPAFTDRKPATYWPHSDHIPTTFWPNTNHILTTYCTDHLYRPHTNQIILFTMTLPVFTRSQCVSVRIHSTVQS